MPAPQAALMQQIAKLTFSSFGILLPTDWEEPSGDPDAQQYFDAFKPSERVAVPPLVPPGLFVAASVNKYHCDTAKAISDAITAYIDGICSAICSAWSQWQSAATLVGVIINAVTAAAGQVVGPPLYPLIMASAPKATPQELLYSNAIANAISAAWLSYTATIKVPGMPWYPMFAAVPSPVAPPTPNIPCPVVTLSPGGGAMLASAVLKGQMQGLLGDPTALHAESLFEALATAFNQCFQVWEKTTMVTNVLGTGPVPTFAPPYVPVGPVVMGVGNMTPGGFA